MIYATWIVLQARLAGDRPTPKMGMLADDGLATPPGDADVAIEVAPTDAVSASTPDPAAAAAIMTSATAGMYALLALSTGASISPADVPSELWPPLLAFGLVATALAIQAFYAGVQRIGAARASIVSTVEPVYTIAMAMILFGEALTPVQLMGGVLVLAAVILAETGQHPAREAPPRPPVVAPEVGRAGGPTG
jgi:uncharacterized membrane protein